MVIKYRMMSGCVIVIGPPFSICFVNRGTTDPLDPNTFPNRVVIYLVVWLFSFFSFCAKDCTYFSAIRLLAPITLLGFTALSVDTITKRSALYFNDRSAMYLLPKTFVNIACCGFISIKGTCLYAAA